MATPTTRMKLELGSSHLLAVHVSGVNCSTARRILPVVLCMSLQSDHGVTTHSQLGNRDAVPRGYLLHTLPVVRSDLHLLTYPHSNVYTEGITHEHIEYQGVPPALRKVRQ